MDINEKYLKEHIKAYCKRCGILNGSKEAFHYEMGLRHGLEENTSKLHQPTVSICSCDSNEGHIEQHKGVTRPYCSKCDECSSKN